MNNNGFKWPTLELWRIWRRPAPTNSYILWIFRVRLPHNCVRQSLSPAAARFASFACVCADENGKNNGCFVDAAPTDHFNCFSGCWFFAVAHQSVLAVCVCGFVRSSRVLLSTQTYTKYDPSMRWRWTSAQDIADSFPFGIAHKHQTHRRSQINVSAARSEIFSFLNYHKWIRTIFEFSDLFDADAQDHYYLVLH